MEETINNADNAITAQHGRHYASSIVKASNTAHHKIIPGCCIHLKEWFFAFLDLHNQLLPVSASDPVVHVKDGQLKSLAGRGDVMLELRKGAGFNLGY